MDNPLLLNQISLNFQPQCSPPRCEAKVYEKLVSSLSSVLLTEARYLWLGADETCTLERLTLLEDGTFGDHLHLHVGDFVALPAGDDHEVDIEGLDYAESYLWLVGSHSHKRKKPKAGLGVEENSDRLSKIDTEANRYLLARIPLVNGQLYQAYPPQATKPQLTAAKLATTRQGNQLTDVLAADEHLQPFIEAKIPGKDNGFDIEGLAVWQNRIFIGLRGPVLRGWAMILELETKYDGDGLLKLKKIGPQGQRYKKHWVDLGGLGVRDLRIQDRDLLILAGPTMDLDGPVRLFRVPDVLHVSESLFSWQPQPLMDLPYGVGDDRAEGFTTFDAIMGQPSILVVYDAPAGKRLLSSPGVLADVLRLG